MRQFLGLRRFLPGNREETTTHDDDDNNNGDYQEPNKPTCWKRDCRTNRLVIMSTSKLTRGPVSNLCRVFSRDSSDNTSSFHTAAPDVSWDESSSSIWTAIRPCLKIFTQEDSLRYSYYDKGGFDSMSYRVDFSTQTVYYRE